MFALMERNGSVDFARHFAAGIGRAASDAFKEAFAAVDDSPDRRFVEGDDRLHARAPALTFRSWPPLVGGGSTLPGLG